MYAKLLYFVGVICQIYSTNASKVPFITKCHRSDGDCMTSSANEVLPRFADGLPDLGVKRMDPMLLNYVDGSTPDLRLIHRNTTMSGMKNCKIEYVRPDLDNNKISISAECTGEVEGKYEADGKLMFLNIQGRGDAHFYINKMLFNFECNISERKGDDGQMYFQIKNVKHTYELRDDCQIEMNGLFDQNESLKNAVDNLLHTRANDIIMEIGTPMIKAYVDILIENIENFFNAVPIEDVILD